MLCYAQDDATSEGIRVSRISIIELLVGKEILTIALRLLCDSNPSYLFCLFPFHFFFFLSSINWWYVFDNNHLFIAYVKSSSKLRFKIMHFD